MAKVGFILLCDEVFNNQGHLTIDKPLAHIAPYSIPGQFSFTLSFSVFDIEPRKIYLLKIKMISPENELIWDMNLDFNFDDRTPETVQSTVLNIPFKNMLIKENGIHKFEINLNDGEDIKFLEFPIREQKVKGNE